MERELPAVQKCYDILKDLSIRVSKYPRDYKYVIGDRILVKMLDCLDLLIEAVFRKDKAELLRQANLKIDQLRYLLRLSRELGILPNKGYAFVSENLIELGKQIGGWIKEREKKGGEEL